MIKYIEDFHLIAKVSIPTSLKFEEYVMNMSIEVVNDMLSRYNNQYEILFEDLRLHWKRIKLF